MSVHAQYLVQCVGGGWLCPGRPLACLGAPTRFKTKVAAFRAAEQAAWSYDELTHEHRCPAHQTGVGHVHSFSSPPCKFDDEWSVPVIQKCPCGEERKRPW